MEKYIEQIKDMAVLYAPKLLLAIVILLIGFWLIKRFANWADRSMEKGNVDVSLRKFLHSLINIGLKILLIISAAGVLGMQTTSFVVVLGAASLAVGLALQGSLANFAGGVLVLIFKPYKVGDLIDAQGQFGRVLEIQIFNTIIETLDLKTVIIPNGLISNGVITNVTRKGVLRVDLVIGISCGSDIPKAKQVCLEVMRAHEAVLEDPAPEVHVLELADSSVNLAVRPYATPENYWAAYFGITEGVKLALDKNGIEIPFPQRDLHVKGPLDKLLR
jgi:small conductance mechanosensitive channel